MFLRYIGRHTPIALMIKKGQSMGISVKHGEVFECTHGEGATIINQYNKHGHTLFVEAEAPKAAKPKKGSKKELPDKNKMLDDMLKA